MAYAMTKQGSLDNCITYEFICDTIADMNAIENRYRTLGSITVVLSGESEGLEVYIAGSDKAWNNLGSMGAGSGDSAAGLSIYICTQGEYDTTTKVPTVEEPDETSLYLVPASEESGNLYDEYVYVNNAWEKFGGGRIDLSGYAPIANPNFTDSVSLDRYTNSTVGTLSVALGRQTQATGNYSFAEGNYTTASGSGAHAEGQSTVASGYNSHAEGLQTKARGEHSHAEGKWDTGNQTTTYNNTTYYYGASGVASHSEGINTIAHGDGSHAEGKTTQAIGANSHAEGLGATTTAINSHAEGRETLASGIMSHAEGFTTTASGSYAHAEGHDTTASGQTSHVEGQDSVASGDTAHAEGGATQATGVASHAEGAQTQAIANYSHAEGGGSIASGHASHAEGMQTIAAGKYEHVSGAYNVADTAPAWVASTSYQVGDLVSYSGKIYKCKTANSDSTFSTSKWSTSGQYLVVVGNGTADNARSNAYTLDWEGNETIAGSLILNGNLMNGTSQAGNSASGMYSQAHGYAGNYASGDFSLAIGNFTNYANGSHSLALGQGTNYASGDFSLAIGQQNNKANGNNSIALGYSMNMANGDCSIAIGKNANIAGGDHSIAIGHNLVSPGKYQCSLGKFNAYQTAPSWAASTNYAQDDIVIQDSKLYKCITANTDAEFTASKWEHIPYYLVTIGNGTADNTRSNAYALDWEGNSHFSGNVYVNCNSNSTGGSQVATINDIPDISGKANKTDTILETTLSRGRKANTTVGTGSFAFGNNVEATGSYTHAEGYYTKASDSYGHAEGYLTQATGQGSHAEGQMTLASGEYSHAEGYKTSAEGKYSYAGGYDTIAERARSHVFGSYNVRDKLASWPEWQSSTQYQVGDKVKYTSGTAVMGYICKQANNSSSWNSSYWNQAQIGEFIEIIGNGTANNERSNARALDWEGNERLKGDIYINCNSDSTGGTAIGALVSGYESRISALETEIASLRATLTAEITSLRAALDTLIPIPQDAVVMEDNEPLTDEEGNVLVYDIPST